MKWYLCIFVVLYAACSSPKQALRLIEKQKYAQAQKKLDKALSKDSLQAAAHYAYSVLYTDTAFMQYHVDSAYAHILEAIDDYQRTEEKVRRKLSKKMLLDSTALLTQRLLTDSLAFAEAAEVHTVAAYQGFIDRHQAVAPQYEEAISRRNALAFEAARQTDTYQAYKAFMETYPQAVQYPQAQERYNTLVFREKTKGGTLESYRNFLKAFPDSPYRPNAEEQILRLSTTDNRLTSYAAFVREFPKSRHTRLAVNLLYHLYKAKHQPEHFLRDYPGLPYADSLRQAITLEKFFLVPVLQEDRYGFMDTSGTVSLPPRYPLVAASYLCEGVASDYLHVAYPKNKQLEHHLLTKKGQMVAAFVQENAPPVADGTFPPGFISDMGAGWLLVRQAGGQYSLRHKAGDQIMPEAYPAVDTAVLVPPPASLATQLPYQFIKFEVDGLWGMMSSLGNLLLEPAYESIEEYDTFITLEKNGKLAVINRESILKKTDQAPSLNFQYEDVAPIERDYLIAYTSTYETVLDRNLQAVVPLGNHTVVRYLKARRQWLLKKNTLRQFVRNDSLISMQQPSYFLYGGSESGSPAYYQKAFYNERWLALQNGKQFTFYDLADKTMEAVYDSVKLLSENLVLLFGQDSVTARFANQEALTLERFSGKNEVQFRLLTAAANELPAQRDEYLLIVKGDKKQLINGQGRRLFAASFDEVIPYQPNLFAIDKQGKKGLVDSTGTNLVPIRYPSIGNYQDGLLALFDKQKFGFYYYKTQTLVKPEYEAIVRLYSQPSGNDSTARALLIARKQGKYGIIDLDNKALTPFAFDQVQYWNDTVALMQTEEQWQLYWLTAPPDAPAAQRMLVEGIEDYEEIASGTEKRLKIYKDNAYGIVSPTGKILIPAVYDAVIMLGEGDTYLYQVEKYIPEAELYVVLYLDASGNVLRRQTLTAEQYDLIYCEGG